MSLAQLASWEVPWRDKSHILEEQGYILRPRLRPDWVPSWHGDGRNAKYREDIFSLRPFSRHTVDATRISDGRLVCLKKVKTDSEELKIATYMSGPELRDNPRNHCVPILDVFPDPEDKTLTYIVMPFLKRFYEPKLKNIGEVVECFYQYLEGLVFMHDNGITHGHCTHMNLMMDATPLFPQGFHPTEDFMLPDCSGFVSPLRRTFHSVNYLYVGYSKASRVSPDMKHHGKVSNLYKEDVFLLGTQFRNRYLRVYSNLKVLSPLLRAMTHRDPSLRPTARESMKQLKAIRSTMPYLMHFWRLRKRKHGVILNGVLDAVSLVQDGFHFLRIRFRPKGARDAKKSTDALHEDECQGLLNDTDHDCCP